MADLEAVWSSAFGTNRCISSLSDAVAFQIVLIGTQMCYYSGASYNGRLVTWE